MKSGQKIWGDEVKVLHIKVSGTLNEKEYAKLKTMIVSELKEGILITDDSVKTEVIELDIPKVEVGFYE